MNVRTRGRYLAPIASGVAAADSGTPGAAVPAGEVPAQRLKARPLGEFTRMDPKLQRLQAQQAAGAGRVASASTAPDEIAVIAKVTDLAAWSALSEVREGERMGETAPDGSDIVTARIPLGRIDFVRQQPFVKSLKPAQHVRKLLASTTKETLSRPADLGLPATGKGVVVGIVDFGGDFAHQNFRDSAGKTRLLALWDQSSPGSGDGSAVKYGVLHRAAQVNAALKTGQPYQTLGYAVESASHGTHVMDIAAGNGNGTKVPGMAPQAELVFVELSASDVPWSGPQAAGSSFGDSVQLLEAVSFIFREAGGKPCVVNLSLGTNGGPHDGTSLVEEGIDRLVRARPGRAVVIAASNSQGDGIHAAGTVPAGGQTELGFETRFAWNREDEVEVWYPGNARVDVELVAPDGTSFGMVAPGQSIAIDDAEGQPVLATLSNRLHDPNNGDNVISVWLGARMPKGRWTLRMSSAQATGFHGWIERNDGAQASFTSHRVDTHCLGSISCGRDSIVVGSYDAHKAGQPISWFSSAGPTRDGREKPEVSGPGHAVVAARSLSGNKTTTMSGTSMAAPAVAGLVALLLSEALRRGKALNAAQIRQAVIGTARPQVAGVAWDSRYGRGRICGRDALASLGPQAIPVKPKVQPKPSAPKGAVVARSAAAKRGTTRAARK